MTERSVDASAESEIITTPIPPIDVRMVGGETEREAGADFGSWLTFTIAANTPQNQAAQRLLPLDRYRKSAELLVFSGASGQTEVVGANPAAGTNFTYTNNTGAPQQLLSAWGQLVTDATVGNRFPQWVITDAGGNTLAAAVDGTAVVASSTIKVSAYQGGSQQNSAGGTTVLPLPQNLLIPPGGTFQFNGALGGSADQWSLIRMIFAQSATGGGFILVGKKEQVLNGQGGTLFAGMRYPIENVQELWMTGDGINAFTITLLTERWAESGSN